MMFGKNSRFILQFTTQSFLETNNCWSTETDLSSDVQSQWPDKLLIIPHGWTKSTVKKSCHTTLRLSSTTLLEIWKASLLELSIATLSMPAKDQELLMREKETLRESSISTILIRSITGANLRQTLLLETEQLIRLTWEATTGLSMAAFRKQTPTSSRISTSTRWKTKASTSALTQLTTKMWKTWKTSELQQCLTCKLKKISLREATHGQKCNNFTKTKVSSLPSTTRSMTTMKMSTSRKLLPPPNTWTILWTARTTKCTFTAALESLEPLLLCSATLLSTKRFLAGDRLTNVMNGCWSIIMFPPQTSILLSKSSETTLISKASSMMPGPKVPLSPRWDPLLNQTTDSLSFRLKRFRWLILTRDEELKSIS